MAIAFGTFSATNLLHGSGFLAVYLCMVVLGNSRLPHRGATVAFVDAAAAPLGRLRVVIVPDPDAEPWPESQLLRQGARVNGWVLLDQVRLGFELWRQWNGFPPATSAPVSDKGAASKAETAKVTR